MIKTHKALQEKIKERIKLSEKLDRSLAIQELWSKAFKYGRCTTQLAGNLRFNRRDTLSLIITNGNGEKREFPLFDVPKCLSLAAIDYQLNNGKNLNEYMKRDLEQLRKEIILWNEESKKNKRRYRP
jgi:hypothetical protein